MHGEMCELAPFPPPPLFLHISPGTTSVVLLNVGATVRSLVCSLADENPVLRWCVAHALLSLAEGLPFTSTISSCHFLVCFCALCVYAS
jgi:hypothetical protein